MAKLVVGTCIAVAVLSSLGAAAHAQTNAQTSTTPASSRAADTSKSTANASASTPAVAPAAPAVPNANIPPPSPRPAPPRLDSVEEGGLGPRHGRGDHADRAEKDDRETKGRDRETEELKSGRMMRYGVTVGIAAALHVPFFGDTGARGVGASALPYVALFPGIWTQPKTTRAYCTAKWVGEDGPENAATAAAVKETIASIREETKKSGGQPLATYYAPLHDNKHDIEPLPNEDSMNERSKVWAKLFSEGNRPLSQDEAERELTACSDALREATESSDFPAACATTHVHDLVKAYSGWDTERGNRCTWSSIGGYVGLPFAYNINTDIGGPTHSTEMHPYVSSGLVYAPSSFISLILGMTLNNVERSASAGSPAHQFTVPTVTFGLGGNVDILGALIPGK